MVCIIIRFLLRFGTEKYNLSALDRLCSHLTNTSLNKGSPGYSLEKERVGSGEFLAERDVDLARSII